MIPVKYQLVTGKHVAQKEGSPKTFEYDELDWLWIMDEGNHLSHKSVNGLLDNIYCNFDSFDCSSDLMWLMATLNDFKILKSVDYVLNCIGASR